VATFSHDALEQKLMQFGRRVKFVDLDAFRAAISAQLEAAAGADKLQLYNFYY
jgi:hypothetical protein